ncbi:MAG: hypothetical protein GY953_41690, partial [bacterium]|nr:hypothetical protein [bacterium]
MSAPFAQLVPAAPVPPDGGLPTDFGKDSFEAWERIAAELEAKTAIEAEGLEVRPPPAWVSPLPLSGAPTTVLGAAVSPESLPRARARTLYQWLLRFLAIGLWAAVILKFWQRRILETIQNAGGESTGWIHRLQEEIWYSTERILRPACAVVLLVSATFLLPENYGSLA